MKRQGEAMIGIEKQGKQGGERRRGRMVRKSGEQKKGAGK
jgi:hypothetical protein